MNQHKESRTPNGLRLPGWAGLIAFLGIAVFFLWEEHKVHILSALPWVLLALCPLLHLFMHGGYGHGGGHGHHSHDVTPPRGGNEKEGSGS
ncbi:MAG: DUF2933 domain-containing protein [Candidatus Latescibacteria bacterium]|nr:DUF2933 domain-containing protein [Candidatus Latescibacterota bacterium]NIO29250.1 DUF2933 domain-containing protein [Candidatus Latescibacterota bacterium]NIO56874.1 DUF2933 domain-containing protein [Candidatus Latescibacterota bacterium]